MSDVSILDEVLAILHDVNAEAAEIVVKKCGILVVRLEETKAETRDLAVSLDDVLEALDRSDAESESAIYAKQQQDSKKPRRDNGSSSLTV